MSRPVDLPPASHWADRPHGTRLRYISGCRCVPCRAAHSRYVCLADRRKRTGKGNPIVDAAPVAAHLRRLSRGGLGYKRAAAIAGVSKTTLEGVLAGRRRHVRKRTADRVLAVTASLQSRAPRALLPAAPTWRLLSRLIADGYPKVRLARLLGQHGSGLQIGRHQVTVATARKVRALAAYLLADDALLEGAA